MSGDYEQFFEVEYGPVLAFLCKAGFEYHIADDATAYAMAEAFPVWRALTNPRSWVRTAAYRDAVRSARARRDELSRLISQGHTQSDRDGTESFHLLELHDELLQVLGQLVGRQKEVMAWHLDGFTTDEISIATGLPQSTVRSNLRHARKTVGKILKDYMGEGGH
jgi:RNA polymerase sigma factor (sigma-70 family)